MKWIQVTTTLSSKRKTSCNGVLVLLVVTQCREGGGGGGLRQRTVFTHIFSPTLVECVQLEPSDSRLLCD